jgi:hypothetical protein
VNKKGPRRRKIKACPFPEKERYTANEATDVSKAFFAKNKIMLYAYKCPAGGHSHVGHKSPFTRSYFRIKR